MNDLPTPPAAGRVYFQTLTLASLAAASHVAVVLAYFEPFSVLQFRLSSQPPHPHRPEFSLSKFTNMDDSFLAPDRSRGDFCLSYDLSEAIYGTLPSRATHDIVRRSRAPSPAARKTVSKKKSAITLRTDSVSTGSAWFSPPRKRLKGQHIEIHQSTCLNLNMAADGATESDLWILPDFDDWELAEEKAAPVQAAGQWAPLLRRAAKSNMERLRARLEGDGWAFVAGKYEEDKKVLQYEASQSEESVDEEFDVVVLPAVHTPC